MNSIKGLEQWEGETKAWNRKAGKLKMRAGVGMIDALENWYSAWQTKHTDRNRRQYLTWRLRLHLKHNADIEFLQELDETFNIGLSDEEVGKTLWDLKPEQSTSFSNGFNWRRDSGAALRGGRANRQQDELLEGVEEPDA